jgi:DASS family divalent anion:Na+ symporter
VNLPVLRFLHWNECFRKILIIAVLILIGCGFALLPQPEGVNPNAYPMLGIFIALIVGILLKPYPIAILALCGLFTAIALGFVALNDGLRSFGESVLWLIAFSSIAAKSFVTTNLGRRLACFFIQKTGSNAISLA